MQVANSPPQPAMPFRGTVGVRRTVSGRMFARPIWRARLRTTLPVVAQCLHFRVGRYVLSSLQMIQQKQPALLQTDLC